jgi:hypothetical protein
LPVDSLSAYRACDSAAWFPRGIRDGIFVVGGCWGLFSVQANPVAGLSYVLGKFCMPILGTGCCGLPLLAPGLEYVVRRSDPETCHCVIEVDIIRRHVNLFYEFERECKVTPALTLSYLASLFPCEIHASVRRAR